jgi:DnaJ domain
VSWVGPTMGGSSGGTTANVTFTFTGPWYFRSIESIQEIDPFEEDLKMLKASREMSPVEIRRAFRKRARETHPDLGGDSRFFLSVHEAYERLKRAGLAE